MRLHIVQKFSQFFLHLQRIADGAADFFDQGADEFSFHGDHHVGGLAGIILAGVEGLFSGLHVSKGLRTGKKILIVSFNSAMMLTSTTLTILTVHLFFGPIADLRFQDISHFIAAVGTMALIQYVANTGISTIRSQVSAVGRLKIMAYCARIHARKPPFYA